MYNDINITNANNIVEIGRAFNDLTGGFFFSLMIFILIFVWMATFKKSEFKDVFLVGTFLGAIISILMAILRYVEYSFAITPIVAFFVALFIYIFTKE